MVPDVPPSDSIKMVGTVGTGHSTPAGITEGPDCTTNHVKHTHILNPRLDPTEKSEEIRPDQEVGNRKYYNCKDLPFTVKNTSYRE